MLPSPDPLHQDPRPLRVLLLAGSNRRENNCPGRPSKARALVERMAHRLPEDWEVDTEDLGNDAHRPRIQPCNACVSTSMALCVWPCNCYYKGAQDQPDLLWEADLYARLDLADAWAVVGPVNWYGPSTVLKLLFDRLVCMNGGNPREDLIDHKDADKAIALERSDAWRELSLNHLEGRSAAFFSYGDGGGDEVGPDGRPRLLRHRDWFDPEEEPFAQERQAYAPLVWQCRYSGLEVPDALWRHATFGEDEPYGANQVEDLPRHGVFRAFDAWTDAFAAHVARKGKVPPGRHRALGHHYPTSNLADPILQ